MLFCTLPTWGKKPHTTYLPAFLPVSEVGSLEGACSRPITPVTYTPRMPPSQSATTSDAEDQIHTTWLQHRGETEGRQKAKDGRHQGVGSSRSPRSQNSSSGEEMRGAAGSKVQSPGDAKDIGQTHRSPRSPEVRLDIPRGSRSEERDAQQRRNQSAVKDGQGSSGDPHASKETDIDQRIGELRKKRPDNSSASDERGNVSSGTVSPETVGKGRGLAALINTSEVGRKRSPSPLTSPTSATTSKSPSNIVKSDNLQKSLDQRHSRGSSPKLSKTPEPPVQASPPSPKQRLLEKDGGISPRPGETQPVVISKTTRLPFLIDRKISPKVVSPDKGASSVSMRPTTASPPSFVSPVSTKQASKIPWKPVVHKGLPYASPSSSDWNKMSSTNGNSDVSDQDVSPERTKKSSVPKPSPTERTKIIKDR